MHQNPLLPPQISVVMPVRNAAVTLPACLASIRAQSFPHYELIVVNDGSTDDSAAILQAWAARDSRIRIKNIQPSGIAPALNVGLAMARAPLVARMDADDLMLPRRLEKQADYLQSHPKVDLVACQVELFPAANIRGGYQEYIGWQNRCLGHDDIVEEIYVESPLAHPSVMFRRESIGRVGGYREGEFPEDYELWLRMATRGCRFHKLPETLLLWREGEDRASRVDSRYARQAFDTLRARYLARDKRLADIRPLAFWGAGRRTRQRIKHLLDHGFEPGVWIDIDPKKIGNKIHNAWVRPPQSLQENTGTHKPFVLCYVSNHGAKRLIAEQLSTFGYRRGVDYYMVG